MGGWGGKRKERGKEVEEEEELRARSSLYISHMILAHVGQGCVDMMGEGGRGRGGRWGGRGELSKRGQEEMGEDDRRSGSLWMGGQGRGLKEKRGEDGMGWEEKGETWAIRTHIHTHTFVGGGTHRPPLHSTTHFLFSFSPHSTHPPVNERG